MSLVISCSHVHRGEHGQFAREYQFSFMACGIYPKYQDQVIGGHERSLTW